MTRHAGPTVKWHQYVQWRSAHDRRTQSYHTDLPRLLRQYRCGGAATQPFPGGQLGGGPGDVHDSQCVLYRGPDQQRCGRSQHPTEVGYLTDIGRTWGTYPYFKNGVVAVSTTSGLILARLQSR